MHIAMMRGPAVLLVACLLGVLSSAFADKAATCTYMYNNNSQFVQSCSVDGESITEEYNLDERGALIGYALPAFILAIIAHFFILVVNPLVLYYGIIRVPRIAASGTAYTTVNKA